MSHLVTFTEEILNGRLHFFSSAVYSISKLQSMNSVYNSPRTKKRYNKNLKWLRIASSEAAVKDFSKSNQSLLIKQKI